MEIQKFRYCDPRITTPDSAFPVVLGASSQITHLVPSVNTSSTTQQRYEFMSEGIDVFNGLDAAQHLDFVLGFKVTVAVGTAGTALGATDPICSPSLNFSLCANPLNSFIKTNNVNLNGVPLTAQQLENVQTELLRLQPPKNSIFQAYPSNLDNIAVYEGADIGINNIMSDYANAVPDVYSPNGAFPFYFCDENGTRLAYSARATIGGVQSYWVNSTGVPVLSADNAAVYTGGALSNIQIYVRYNITEPLSAEPFCHSFNPAKLPNSLNGVNKFSLTFDYKSDVSRSLRTNSTPVQRSTKISSIAIKTIIVSELVITSLNKNLADLELYNTRCIVPYMRYDVNTNNVVSQIPSGSTFILTSNNYNFQEIPSYFMIFAKPSIYSAYATPTVASTGIGEWKYEIQNVSVLGCHGSGSQVYTMTQNQLYNCTVRNGISMDYVNWLGTAMTQNGPLQTTGSIVLLKTGIDFSLGQPQLAPGVADSGLNMQFRVTIRNNTPNTVPANVGTILYVLPIYMQKLVLEDGRMVEIKSPLTEMDVLNTSIPTSDDSGDEMLIGNGFFSSLKNIFSKAKNIYEKSKPYVSAIKSVLPEGQVKGALSSVGYGVGGGKLSGGATRKYA